MLITTLQNQITKYPDMSSQNFLTIYCYITNLI